MEKLVLKRNQIIDVWWRVYYLVFNDLYFYLGWGKIKKKCIIESSCLNEYSVCILYIEIILSIVESCAIIGWMSLVEEKQTCNMSWLFNNFELMNTVLFLNFLQESIQ